MAGIWPGISGVASFGVEIAAAGTVADIGMAGCGELPWIGARICGPLNCVPVVAAGGGESLRNCRRFRFLK